MTQADKSKNVIVVGFDYSSTSEYAVREAMRLARQLPGSELHVASVIETEGQLHSGKSLEQVANELRTRADEVRSHLLRLCAPENARAFKQDVSIHVRVGDAAKALIQLAVDVEADMIVVGTRRRHGMEKLLMGSVAEALVRSAPLPVLVAYPRDLSSIPKTPRPAPIQPGEQLEDGSLSVRAHLEFVPRTPHISGLL